MNSHEILPKSKSELEKLKNAVLGNNLIVSKISNFLPLQDLKTFRRVNSLWNAESKKYFKLRGEAYIEVSDELEMGKSFANKLETLKCHQNFRIVYFFDPLTPMEEEMEKVVQFTSSHEIIKSLDLELYREARTDFKLLARILEEVPTLEELKLFICIRDEVSEEGENWMHEFADLAPLRFIKKFKLISGVVNLKDNSQQFKELFRKLLKLMPNVEVLHLSSNTDDFLNIFLQKLRDFQVEYKPEGPKPFKNLSSFKLPLENLEQLLEISLISIRNLWIVASDEALAEEFHLKALQELLNMNEKTLENLRFDYKINNNLLAPVWKIELPNLPRLKSLNFEVMRYRCKGRGIPQSSSYNEAEKEQRASSFNILETFMMGRQKFEEKFPKLCSFSFEMKLNVIVEGQRISTDDGFNPMIYERILPKPNQNEDLCFPQFTSLDICGPPCEGDLFCSEEVYKEWMQSLVKMFPNVNNPEFTKARRSQQPLQ